MWGTSGINVTLEDINQGSQHLVSDGSGGCVITWKTFSSVFYVNRISENGERLWSDSGLVLGVSHFSGTIPRVIRASDGCYYVETGEYIYRLRDNGEIVRSDSVALGYTISDNAGGIVISGRVWNGMIPKLVSQKKDSLGNNLWQEPYVEIADSLFINSQLSIRYNKNYYFGWTSNKNGIESQPHIQGLRDNGTELFINGGLPLSNSSTTITSFIPIIPSNNMSNIYIWTQWINQPSSTGNFAKRIDTTGTIMWGDFAVLLNYPALRYLGVTTDCLGGAIGIGYLNEDFAIRVFKVSVNGNLGEVIPVELISFTGVLDKDKVILNWITVTELNNLGFEIERLKDYPNGSLRNKIERFSEWETIGFVDGHGTTTETHSYSFFDKDQLSGKVKYRLKQIDYDGTFEYSNVVEVSFMEPNEFSLEQNYPNPFNPTTKIKFNIPQTETESLLQGGARGGLVTLKVYDILGNEVATLVNETKPSGTYEVEFSGVGLASGVYFYQLKTGNYIATKKLVLLK